MTTTDTNLSPDKKGESINKSFAEEKLISESILQQDCIKLQFPTGMKIPVRYNLPDPKSEEFKTISFPIPARVYDLYARMLKQVGSDYDRLEDYLISNFLTNITGDLRDMSIELATKKYKEKYNTAIQQLNSMNDDLMIKISDK